MDHVVGHYQITAELGRGSHGVVYQARDSLNGRTVALKAIKLHTEQQAQSVPTAAPLIHPNIVTVLEQFVKNDFAYIVMEFVPATSFEHLLRSGQALDQSELLDYLKQVAAALDYAHRKGEVHGGLTAADILLFRANGAVEPLAKVNGFGQRQLLQEDTSASVEGDQFSLAAITHELLTGQKVKQAGEVAGSLRPTVAKVMQRALASNVQGRFPTSSDFAGALSIALAEGTEFTDGQSGQSAAEYTGFDDEQPTRTRSSKTTKLRTSSKSGPTAKQLGLLVVLCFLAAAAIIFIVRMNSGQPVPVQVLETKLAPTTAPPSSTGSAETAADTIKSRSGASQLIQPPSTEQTRSSAVAPARDLAETSASRRAPSPAKTATTPGAEAGTGGPDIADVDLISEPPGAKIVVDARADATCTAPCTMSLPSGRHTLTAELGGYAIARRVFNIPESGNLIIPLGASAGTLFVTSSPAGSSVFVDGKSFGQTPVTLHLPSGMHTLLLFNGAHQHQETISVQPDSFQTRSIRW